MSIELIPRIWADHLEASLKKQVFLGWDYMQKEMEQYKLSRTELQQAEDEAEGYWTALYDNQLPEYEEDEW